MNVFVYFYLSSICFDFMSAAFSVFITLKHVYVSDHFRVSSFMCFHLSGCLITVSGFLKTISIDLVLLLNHSFASLCVCHSLVSLIQVITVCNGIILGHLWSVSVTGFFFSFFFSCVFGHFHPSSPFSVCGQPGSPLLVCAGHIRSLLNCPNTHLLVHLVSSLAHVRCYFSVCQACFSLVESFALDRMAVEIARAGRFSTLNLGVSAQECILTTSCGPQ